METTTVRDKVPFWEDNYVLRELDRNNLSCRVVYDSKYLDGICNKPLIVITRKKVSK